MLKFLKIKKIRLLTNNPKKLSTLKDVEISERVPIVIKENSCNTDYLQIKKNIMGHLI
jgi:GTP cyclohydrolase II